MTRPEPIRPEAKAKYRNRVLARLAARHVDRHFRTYWKAAGLMREAVDAACSAKGA